MTIEQLRSLPARKQRGSCPRCLLLTEGPREQVARNLSMLAGSKVSVDAARHHWMPQGFGHYQEARIGRTAGFLTPDRQGALTRWWLVHRKNANLPNWDIASTATIAGSEGLLLFEAKAHANELHVSGKPPGNADNHERIGEAIAEANAGLNRILSGWALSRDSHYQLANRFAWAWKIASLGVPVALVYLGFLRAGEMGDQGLPFADRSAWEQCVRDHSSGVVPAAAWGSRLVVGQVALWPLIRSLDIGLPTAQAGH